MIFVIRKAVPLLWVTWLVLFCVETVAVMLHSSITPGIELNQTHVKARIKLLSMIILGEVATSLTRIVDRPSTQYTAY
jgi:low temperature requirement protein LtrA